MSKKVNLVKVNYRNCVFFMDPEKGGKFEKDFIIVSSILDKGVENLTNIDRFTLLNVYKTSYHDSGKIEGVTSLDSTASNCEFCKAIRQANKDNDLCICNGCYDLQQESYRLNVLNRHSLNMLIMSTVEFTVDELKMLTVTPIVRINSSGDTPNTTYARNMIKLCYAFPFAKVGYWAKNIGPVIKACDELGKPENLTLIQSSCLIGRPATKARYFDFVFTVYPDKTTTEKAIAEGASSCNGKKCKDCGYKCYFTSHDGNGNIAEVLRGASKEKIEAIKALLEKEA